MIGKNVVNIYGAAIVGAASPKVHIYEGEYVYNKTTKEMVNAPDLGAGGLDANHAMTITAVPHADNKIGYQVTIPDDFTSGTFDLVYLDDLTYLGGLRFKLEGLGAVVVIAE